MILSAEGLWELFLQTGIPEAYIAYAQEKQKETEQRESILSETAEPPAPVFSQMYG